MPAALSRTLTHSPARIKLILYIKAEIEDKSFLSTKVPHLGVGSLGRKEVDFEVDGSFAWAVL